MFNKLRTYNSFKVLLLAGITSACIIFSSCEDDVVYEPIDTPADIDCKGSYCKLDKNDENDLDYWNNKSVH